MTVEERFKILQTTLSHNGELIHPRHLLARAAKEWPDHTALICGTEQMNFATLDKQATRCKKQLLHRGIKPGNRILIMYENGLPFYQVYHGAWRTGAIIAPLNIFLTPAELTHIIHDATPSIIIASAKHRDKIIEIAGNIPTITLEELLHDAPAETDVPAEPIPENLDTCTILLYTSGTTGLPKGVMLSGRAILTNCLQGICDFEISEEERVYAPLPLFHSYMQNTAVWSPLIVGAATIIVPQIKRSALIEGLDHQPTVVVGIPQLYGLFCLLPKVHFERVRLFFSGGDNLPDKIRFGFEMLYGRRLANGYGLTETAPLISAFFDDVHAPTPTIGRPFYGVKIAIKNNKGEPLPSGEIGTIWVTGKNLMLGYYQKPEETNNVMVNGWFNTGDLGTIDSNGYLIFCGREKDLIVSKGMNIYPPEVENILTRHRNVTVAAVVGFKTEDEEIPVAFVAITERNPKLVDELRDLCLQYLAPYKIPRHFIIRGSLPMTATGKVDKKILRKEIAEEMLKENSK
ncbi:MAG: AMP-binding protein [Candidatus Babeliaceae bacterium]|nr:AMP-binding protein [Candidatus Babeliaceae bacterium]